MSRKTSSLILTKPGRVAEVALTQGKVAIIDAADVLLVAPYKWHAVKAQNTFYARTCIYTGGRWLTVPMHRIIAGLEPGDKTVTVDHIDRNGLNNRRKNLRIANGTVQKLNQSTRRDNTSGTSGVHLRPNGTWQARISIAGKRLSLGHFATHHAASQCQEAVREAIARMLAEVAPSLKRSA